MSIKTDLENITGGKNDATNFTSQLLRLLMKSDRRHTELLRSVFPNEVKTLEHWRETEDILDLPYS